MRILQCQPPGGATDGELQLSMVSLLQLFYNRGGATPLAVEQLINTGGLLYITGRYADPRLEPQTSRGRDAYSVHSRTPCLDSPRATFATRAAGQGPAAASGHAQGARRLTLAARSRRRHALDTRRCQSAGWF